MPCPRCRSHRIWDDNLAWGCCDCSFFTTGEIRNTGDTSRDVFHEPAPDGGWQPEGKTTDATPDDRDDGAYLNRPGEGH